MLSVYVVMARRMRRQSILYTPADPVCLSACTHAPSEPTRATARRVAWESEAASAAATEGGKGGVPLPPSPPLLPRLMVVFVSLLLLLLLSG